MRFEGKLWISQLLGLNIVSKSTYFQLLLKMSVLLEGTNQIIMENLGRCINKWVTVGEEIAMDRKSEFIQVL